MEYKNQLEREIIKSSLVKKFDWREWTPLLGAYITPRNMLRGDNSHSTRGYMNCVNGIYHGLVSFYPAIHAISKLFEKCF